MTDKQSEEFAEKLAKSFEDSAKRFESLHINTNQLNDNVWFISMAAKEVRDQAWAKSRVFGRFAKDKIKQFDEEHPEALSWAIMGGSTLLSIGYLWWAKWYSDRWMEEIIRKVKEDS